MMNFKMTGRDQVLGTLRTQGRGKVSEVKRGAEIEMDVELQESNRRCPKKTGALVATGTRHPATVSGNVITVPITYGGGDVDYAIYVHEDPEAHHPNGQFKFLESTLRESAPYMAERIALHVRK